MIPAVNDDLQNDFEVEQEPSRTFKVNIDSNRIIGYTDGLDSVKQASYLLLNIERYEYLIYSWNFGIETRDLFGQPISYVLPELKRRIIEALTQDDRIESVDAFSFDVIKGKVHASFTVHSVYGSFDEEKVVRI